jgi:hypothetical protein
MSQSPYSTPIHMVVTASAVAARGAATQAQARHALTRRAEAYHSSQGLEIPIAFLVGRGRKLSSSGTPSL